MGWDITIKIYDKNKKFKKNIDFDGRDSEWFDNLRGRGWERVYDCLDSYKEYDIEEYIEDYASKWYSDGFRITVENFRNWVNKCKPFLCAGWVHKYTEWEFRKRGLIPKEDDVYKYLPADERPKEDFVWLEWTNDYNNDVWLLSNIEDLEENDSIIILFNY